jgi:hypothetical protein
MSTITMVARVHGPPKIQLLGRANVEPHLVALARCLVDDRVVAHASQPRATPLAMSDPVYATGWS